MTWSDCSPWQMALRKDGYGSVRFRGKTALAHRVAFEKATGVGLPPSMKVLHACDNRACVNVEHLRRGTQAENVLDMIQKGRGNNQLKTHCPRGHEYDTVQMGQRRCKTCIAMYTRNLKARKRAAATA